MFPKRSSPTLCLALCAALISGGSFAQTRDTLKGGSEYDKKMQQAGMSGMSAMSGDGSMVAKKPVAKKKRGKAKSKKADAAQ